MIALHDFSGIPAPLYLLVLVPYAGYFYLRRYRPDVKLTTFGGRTVEWATCFCATVLILLGLYILSVSRLGLAYFAH